MYTSFNKPKTIAQGSTTSTLTYDAGFNRLIKSNSSGTTIYIGKLYERVTSGSTATQKHYIYAGPNLVGMYSLANGTPITRYFHTDHLGSVEVITNESGGAVQRLSYDAFGKRRNVNGTDATGITAQTTRGFTRHEHDDEVNLINMNAREYDYVIGRFITPDTLIPGALNSQSYNRYSYVNNNPLSLVDPSGLFHKKVKKLAKKVFKATKKIVDPFELRDNRYVRIAVAAVAAYYTAGAASSWFLSSAGGSAFATSAFASGDIYAAYAAQGAIYVGGGVVGGAVGGATAGGVICGSDCARQGAKGGAVAGGIFAGANLMSEDWNTFGRIGTNATAGGLSNDLQGRSFSDGFRYNALFSGAQEWTDYLASKSGLTARDSNGKLRTDGTRNIDPNNKSIFGSIGMNLEGTNHWYENIPGVRNLIVDVSKVHDTMNSWRYDLGTGNFVPFGNAWADSLFDVYSFAGMLPAASFTLKGPQYGAPPYGPVY